MLLKQYLSLSGGGPSFGISILENRYPEGNSKSHIEFTQFFENREVHHRVHNRPPVDHMRNHVSHVHALMVSSANRAML
jgi:hypothetical protein